MTITPHVTIWRNNKGCDVDAARGMDLPELERVIRSGGTKRTKDELPLVKLANFGDLRTKKGSLRHDSNITAIHGVEGDYDDEKLAMESAAEMLAKQGVAAILYESPSATPERPRWRVIAPLSMALEGTTEQLKQQHAHWVGVLNALLGGILARESFVLSQSFYFGRVEDTPERELIRLDGKCLDQLEDIPAPLIKEAKINGHAGTGQGARLDGVASGEHIYNNTRDYAARLIAKGLSKPEALELLQGYLLGHKGAWQSDSKQQARWQEVWDKLPNMIEGADGKYVSATVVDGEAAWPEPVNILSELSAPEFRPEDMPPALSEFPAAYAAASGVDPSLALTAALTCAAAALSDDIQIVADSATEWFQQARIWVVGIGRPGAAKTPTQREMLKPLWRIHQSLDKQYHEFIAANPEETKPPRPRVIVADTTIEALSEALRDNPRGLLIANDEFESWLGSLDTYRRGGASRDRGEWLRVFDGGPHTIERVQRGPVYVKNWGASILTATTPATLAKLSRQLPEDGLLQRFIPVWVRSVGEPRSVPELEDLRNRYTETLTRLYNAVPRAHKGCVPMSYQAQEFFKDWVRRSRVTAEGFGSIETALESHLAKYPTFLLRIALVFHAAEIVNQDHESARDPAAFQVPLSTAQAAAAFLKRASRHAIATYLNRDGSEAYQLARDVARAVLARAWKAVARRELVQGVPAFRKATPELQDAVLRLLVDLGWLRHLEGGYQKPLPARFMVNPNVQAKFAAIAAQERDRRTAVREAMTASKAERTAA